KDPVSAADDHFIGEPISGRQARGEVRFRWVRNDLAGNNRDRLGVKRTYLRNRRLGHDDIAALGIPVVLQTVFKMRGQKVIPSDAVIDSQAATELEGIGDI